MPQRLFRVVPYVAALVTLAFSVACRDPIEAGIAGACPQTYEFGNTGCFEVRGTVVGTAGQALAGIFVGPRPITTRAGFNSYFATTDAAGRFNVRLARMFGRPPLDGTPDTLSVYVVAVDPRTAGVGIPATVRDSALVVVTVAPVGAVPTPNEVRLTLAVPPASVVGRAR